MFPQTSIQKIQAPLETGLHLDVFSTAHLGLDYQQNSNEFENIPNHNYTYIQGAVVSPDIGIQEQDLFGQQHQVILTNNVGESGFYDGQQFRHPTMEMRFQQYQQQQSLEWGVVGQNMHNGDVFPNDLNANTAIQSSYQQQFDFPSEDNQENTIMAYGMDYHLRHQSNIPQQSQQQINPQQQQQQFHNNPWREEESISHGFTQGNNNFLNHGNQMIPTNNMNQQPNPQFLLEDSNSIIKNQDFEFKQPNTNDSDSLMEVDKNNISNPYSCLRNHDSFRIRTSAATCTMQNTTKNNTLSKKPSNTSATRYMSHSDKKDDTKNILRNFFSKLKTDIKKMKSKTVKISWMAQILEKFYLKHEADILRSNKFNNLEEFNEAFYNCYSKIALDNLSEGREAWTVTQNDDNLWLKCAFKEVCFFFFSKNPLSYIYRSSNKINQKNQRQTHINYIHVFLEGIMNPLGFQQFKKCIKDKKLFQNHTVQ